MSTKEWLREVLFRLNSALPEEDPSKGLIRHRIHVFQGVLLLTMVSTGETVTIFLEDEHFAMAPGDFVRFAATAWSDYKALEARNAPEILP